MTYLYVTNNFLYFLSPQTVKSRGTWKNFFSRWHKFFIPPISNSWHRPCQTLHILSILEDGISRLCLLGYLLCSALKISLFFIHRKKKFIYFSYDVLYHFETVEFKMCFFTLILANIVAYYLICEFRTDDLCFVLKINITNNERSTVFPTWGLSILFIDPFNDTWINPYSYG